MLFIGIDVGTSAAKGVLIDEKGNVLADASLAYPLLTPKPNWAEQNPKEWWNACVEVFSALTAKAGKKKSEIGAVGLSGQMHSLVALDKANAVIRPAILWCDMRTTKECKWIRERVGDEHLRDFVGNPALEGFTLPKILWLKNNELENYEKIACVLMPKDYIRFRLTGELATDVSDASGTLLFDVKRRTWSAQMLQEVGVPRSWMPSAVESAEISGKITAAAAKLTGLPAGTPVMAGGADNTCGAIGTGVVRTGRALASIGTSGVVFAQTDGALIEPRMRAHAFCHSIPKTWYVMGVMLMAGGALRWFKDEFGKEESASAKRKKLDVYDLIAQEAAMIPAGSEGLFFLPYLAGERTPHQSSAARGAFIGATMRHTKAHFYRAVFEGITYGMKDSLEVMRALRIEVKQVRLTGGGARSAFWRQLQADIYGCEVVVVSPAHGAAFGAALLAAAGVKSFADVVEAAENSVKITERLAPSPKLSRRYEEYFDMYSNLYPSLEPAYTLIQKTFHQI
jgi:xylulokinase